MKIKGDKGNYAAFLLFLQWEKFVLTLPRKVNCLTKNRERPVTFGCG